MPAASSSNSSICSVFFAGTEDDAEWQVFFEFPLVLRQPAEAELHLDFAFGLEVALLQIYDHQALEFAVVGETSRNGI